MSAHYNLKAYKQQLRADYLARRGALDSAEKEAMDSAIVAALLRLSSYRYAETVLLYYPRPDEIDTRPILQAALNEGKRVALPRTREGGLMDFYYIAGEADLEKGSFGIPCPGVHCEKFEPATADAAKCLVIVPGLAFDRTGYRLGYGKGFYDRYLEGRRLTTAGLAYSTFIPNSLPRGRYDLPVHFIVTEKGVLPIV